VGAGRALGVQNYGIIFSLRISQLSIFVRSWAAMRKIISVHIVDAERDHIVDAERVHIVDAERVHIVDAERDHIVDAERVHIVDAERVHIVDAERSLIYTSSRCRSQFLSMRRIFLLLLVILKG